MLLLCLLTVAAISLPKARPASSVALIGEEAIEDVRSYAERLKDEAEGFLDSPESDWDHVGSYERGLQVFSRPVNDNKVGVWPFQIC